jgi:uncharacterized protein
VSEEEQIRSKVSRQLVSPPYQILCLSGGGYRGLYTAALLEKLEAQAGKPLCQVFDLIAGTSIGGILALGLGAGISSTNLAAAFEKNADKIFPKHHTLFGRKVFPRLSLGLFSARYPATGLKETLEEILGDKAQTQLKDLSTDILVCGVELTSGTARLFRSADDGCTTPLIDIGLATSAAPTYFPEHLIDNAILVDGGLVANAPDMLAILQALRQSELLSELRLLSIGTAGREGAKAYRKQQSPGVIFAGKSTFELTLDAQEDLSVRTAQELLGDRHIRLDLFPSEDERQSIGLDKTGNIASKTLRLMADRTWKQASDSHQATLRDMLNRNRNHQREYSSKHRPT